jgi:hypothetical protein
VSLLTILRNTTASRRAVVSHVELENVPGGAKTLRYRYGKNGRAVTTST